MTDSGNASVYDSDCAFFLPVLIQPVYSLLVVSDGCKTF